MGAEASRSYRAEQVSVTSARRFVADVVRSWGFDADLADDAALCTAELVTNAILHAHTGIDLVVRRLGGGVRVDVRDRSSKPVEVLVSTVAPGEASVLDDETMSGRGLLVVEGIAAAWGVDYGADGKTVWFTVGDADDPAHRRTFAPAAPTRPDRHPVLLAGIPVRVSVASGNNVDDVLREVQLLAIDDVHARGISPSLVTDVERALRQSAPGRHASRRAAAAALRRGDDRYDLEIRVGGGAGDQLDRLNGLLEEVAARCEAGVLLSLAPSSEVIAFRRWCASEVHAQLAGRAPGTCPFPT